MTARRAVSCLRQVTKPVRVKRRWPHHLRQSLKVRADSDASIARQARFVTAAVFVVAPLGAMHNRLTDYAQLFNYMRLLKLPCGIIVNFYPKFATIERYFYDTDNLEILTSDGIPFQNRQMGTGELARAPKVSCFK